MGLKDDNGNAIYLPSGTVASNDGTYGLFLYQYEPNAATLDGVVSSSGGGTLADATAEYTNLNNSMVTDGTGAYRFSAFPGAGNVIDFSAFGHDIPNTFAQVMGLKQSTGLRTMFIGLWATLNADELLGACSKDLELYGRIFSIRGGELPELDSGPLILENGERLHYKSEAIYETTKGGKVARRSGNGDAHRSPNSLSPRLVCERLRSSQSSARRPSR